MMNWRDKMTEVDEVTLGAVLGKVTSDEAYVIQKERRKKRNKETTRKKKTRAYACRVFFCFYTYVYNIYTYCCLNIRRRQKEHGGTTELVFPHALCVCVCSSH